MAPYREGNNVAGIKTRIAAGLGAAVATVAIVGSAGAGAASAAPWSPGCLTWHVKGGACFGGQEGKNFQKGTTCAGSLLGGGPLTVYTSANDPEYRQKCFNLNNA